MREIAVLLKPLRPVFSALITARSPSGEYLTYFVYSNPANLVTNPILSTDILRRGIQERELLLVFGIPPIRDSRSRRFSTKGLSKGSFFPGRAESAHMERRRHGTPLGLGGKAPGAARNAFARLSDPEWHCIGDQWNRASPAVERIAGAQVRSAAGQPC